MAWEGTARHGTARHGMKVQGGGGQLRRAVQDSGARQGRAGCKGDMGASWRGAARHGASRQGTARHGTARHGTAQSRATRHMQCALQ